MNEGILYGVGVGPGGTGTSDAKGAAYFKGSRCSGLA